MSNPSSQTEDQKIKTFMNTETKASQPLIALKASETESNSINSVNPVNPINPVPEPHSPPLTQFTQPSILEAIGPTRLTRFFNEFAPDLQAAKISVPVSQSESGDATYFHSITVLFSSPVLPE